MTTDRNDAKPEAVSNKSNQSKPKQSASKRPVLKRPAAATAATAKREHPSGRTPLPGRDSRGFFIAGNQVSLGYGPKPNKPIKREFRLSRQVMTHFLRWLRLKVKAGQPLHPDQEVADAIREAIPPILRLILFHVIGRIDPGRANHHRKSGVDVSLFEKMMMTVHALEVEELRRQTESQPSESAPSEPQRPKRPQQPRPKKSGSAKVEEISTAKP